MTKSPVGVATRLLLIISAIAVLITTLYQSFKSDGESRRRLKGIARIFGDPRTLQLKNLNSYEWVTKESDLEPAFVKGETFCAPWNVNSDIWEANHRRWIVSRELGDKGRCFSPIETDSHLELAFRKGKTFCVARDIDTENWEARHLRWFVSHQDKNARCFSRIDTESHLDLAHGRGKTFCAAWNINTDVWEANHPEWFLSRQGDKGRCFSPIETESDMNAAASRRKTFCVPWDFNSDNWWTHNPEWYVSEETPEGYCFSIIENSKKREYMRKVYENQFLGDCSKVLTKSMWSKGWGADFHSVVSGLKYGMENNRPVQMYNAFINDVLVRDGPGVWHYAAKKDGSASVCPTNDMYCYMLNMTKCEPEPQKVVGLQYEKWTFPVDENGLIQTGIPDRWLLEYAARQQTWLRHQVYLYSTERVQLQTPCTVMHVRRADIQLGNANRFYHEVSDYMAKTKVLHKNILLLTDDQNAIEEATTEFPDYNWMYFDRPRYKGSEGGWEQQIPSDDPRLEVIAILSIFRLAKQCNSFTYQIGNFANYIHLVMQEARGANMTSVSIGW